MNLDYFAGYFDGDGHVSGRVDRQRGMLLIAGVTGSIRERLEEFQGAFGGKIHKINHKGKTGNITPKRTTWQWQVYSTEGEEFARAMLPYVRSKGRQLELFLEMRATVGTPFAPLPEGTWELRHELLDELRGLNHGKYSKT